MEPRFQTSFIPKKPVVSNQAVTVPVIRTTNVFSLVANVFLTVSILFGGGLFFYKYTLENQILEADAELNAAREAFQLDKIQELIDVNARMSAINGLLDKHVAVSKFLVFMQNSTIKNVRFDELSYKHENNLVNVTMKAEGRSYNALAFQGDIFSKSEFIENPYFSGFTPMENGLISASFSSDINVNLVSYKNSVESLSINYPKNQPRNQ